MSALYPQKRTHALQQNRGYSFTSSAVASRGSSIETKRLGNFKIDHQFKLGRQLYRQVGSARGQTMTDAQQDRIKLFQFPRMFGIPNISPFCCKLETWLRMTGMCGLRGSTLPAPFRQSLALVR